MSAHLARVETGGYIYALKFTGGIVKVGKSYHPLQRLDSHLRGMRVIGERLVDWWFSNAHDHYALTESLAIDAAKELMTAESSQAGREWFINIDYGALVDRCVALAPCSYGYDLPGSAA